MHETKTEPAQAGGPPIFNLPGVITALGAILLAIHASIDLLADQQAHGWILTVFAFIPATYDVAAERLVVPASRYWSPLTYGFLHGDWTHLLVNLVWLAAFGSVVARRFRTFRFLLFMGLGTVAGAAAHFVFHLGDAVPVVGASGAVSACVGAALRFALRPGLSQEERMRPALTVIQSLGNRQIMTFAVIWFGLNFLVGSGVIPIPGAEGGIAWEAHMGGFLFGWLAFALFDPVGNAVTS